jgi:enoyl-CoA hydratase/carnithine racemase
VIRVEADGPVRIVHLSRPEHLNAINEELHLALTRLFPQLSADADARVAVITGDGRAFSAGGDFDLLDRMAKDRALRANVIAEGRELVLNMIRCRVWLPRSTARRSPRCSVIALDVVYMAESAYLSDPHVTVGLVAADGGPLTAAHSCCSRGRRSPGIASLRSAAEIGLATTCAPMARLTGPRRRTKSPSCSQAVESTKQSNLHLARCRHDRFSRWRPRRNVRHAGFANVDRFRTADRHP